MDFDKILHQWDELQKGNVRKPKEPPRSGKKPNAPRREAEEEKKDSRSPAIEGHPAEASPSREDRVHDYLSHWITVHGILDKDGAQNPDRDEDKQARIRESERLRRMEPQAVLDLHGNTAAEAEEAVRSFLRSCFRSGLEKALIIHGKGNHSTSEHIMTDLVRKMLETDDFAGSFGPADQKHGGRGATWVRIRKRDYFSR